MSFTEACPHTELIDDVNVGFRMIKNSVLPDGFEDQDGAGHINEALELAQGIAEDFRCRVCGGMVVDLATAQIYCGRQVPAAVIESNQRILAS